MVNEKNYTLLYKFIVRAHVMQMQNSYDQAHEKIATDQLAEKEVARQAAESSPQGEEYGADNFKYSVPDFPLSAAELEKYHQTVNARVAKKYAYLTKNVYFYLCYAHLELMDFNSCIKNGSYLLDTYGKELSVKTKFNTLQYLVEACCMIGKCDRAWEYLRQSQELIEGSSETLQSVETLVNN